MATSNRSGAHTRLLSRALFLGAGVLVAASAHAVDVRYRYIDLGTLNRWSSVGFGINNPGQVAGYAGYDTAPGFHGTLWTGTTPINLDTSARVSEAYGINDLGQVVGAGRPINGSKPSRGLLWNGTVATELPTLGGGGTSVAYDINNAGQAVGVSSTTAPIGSGLQHATLWNGTMPTDLGTLGGLYSVAYAINDAGQAVGISTLVEIEFQPMHATSWTGSTATDLGSLEGGYWSYGIAYGINNAGDIVGYSALKGDLLHATLWKDGTPMDLGALGAESSFAFDINEAGQVVGVSGNQAPGPGGSVPPENRAVLWDGGVIIDLNSFLDAATVDAGWHLSEAVGINDRGWITGTAFNPFIGTHAFVLVPIPEPETYALMLAGLGALLLVSRRRQMQSFGPRGKPASS